MPARVSSITRRSCSSSIGTLQPTSASTFSYASSADWVVTYGSKNGLSTRKFSDRLVARRVDARERLVGAVMAFHHVAGDVVILRAEGSDVIALRHEHVEHPRRRRRACSSC